MMRAVISKVILCLALTACVAISHEKTQDRSVMHIVLIWMQDQGNQNHIQQVMDVSEELKEIPGIQEMRVGKSIPSDRKIVDDSFDVGIYMKFNSLLDMENYLEHERHKQAVKTVIKPLAIKILVYDISIPTN